MLQNTVRGGMGEGGPFDIAALFEAFLLERPPSSGSACLVSSSAPGRFLDNVTYKFT